MNTFPALPLPDLPITVTPEYKMNEVTFGDGYALSAPNGINARTDKVVLNWTDINKTEFDILIAFFTAHAPATPFRYTPPNGTQRVFKCSQWSYTQTSAGHYSAQATLIQFHGAA
jgi:phage-related protein